MKLLIASVAPPDKKRMELIGSGARAVVQEVVDRFPTWSSK